MGKLLNRIFEEIIQNEADVIESNCQMDEEIKQILESYEGYEGEVSEELRDKFFDAAFTAQRKGFMLGMRYAVKLYTEITEQ